MSVKYQLYLILYLQKLPQITELKIRAFVLLQMLTQNENKKKHSLLL